MSKRRRFRPQLVELLEQRVVLSTATVLPRAPRAALFGTFGRPSRANLAVRSAAPLSSVAIMGRFDPSAPTTVIFAGPRGQQYRITPSSITADRLEVGAPIFFSQPTRGVVGSGRTRVTVIQETQGRMLRSQAGMLTIRELPRTDGLQPGAVLSTYYSAVQQGIETEIQNFHRLGAASGGKVNVGPIVENLELLHGQIAGIQASILPLMNGEVQQIPLGHLQGRPVNLNADSLVMIDRMLLAAAEARVGSPPPPAARPITPAPFRGLRSPSSVRAAAATPLVSAQSLVSASSVSSDLNSVIRSVDKLVSGSLESINQALPKYKIQISATVGVGAFLGALTAPALAPTLGAAVGIGFAAGAAAYMLQSLVQEGMSLSVGNMFNSILRLQPSSGASPGGARVMFDDNAPRYNHNLTSQRAAADEGLQRIGGAGFTYDAPLGRQLEAASQTAREISSNAYDSSNLDDSINWQVLHNLSMIERELANTPEPPQEAEPAPGGPPVVSPGGPPVVSPGDGGARPGEEGSGGDARPGGDQGGAGGSASGDGGPTDNQSQGQYTLVFYNLRDPRGWFRTGFVHDNFTSLGAVQQSIAERVQKQRAGGNDFWAYGYARSNQELPPDEVPPGISITLVYTPPGYAPPPVS